MELNSKVCPGDNHNVQEYAQKLRFLAAMWPTGQLHQLAPRAALMVEGTAFRKIAQLDPSKLRVNDQSGVALLVNTIGGSWGSTDFEEKYEYFEKALYGTIQRRDESHDSFLSRMEVNFVELINRGTKLEEVQAYVLLRQSLLPPEDKKRILVEHAGDLKYDPVARSFRLLGSKFFNDLQGGRSSVKTKVYEANVSEVQDAEVYKATEDFASERAFVAHHDQAQDSDELDAETFEIFLAADDQDAPLNKILKTSCRTFRRCMTQWCHTWKLATSCWKRRGAGAFGPFVLPKVHLKVSPSRRGRSNVKDFFFQDRQVVLPQVRTTRPLEGRVPPECFFRVSSYSSSELG